MPKKPDISAEVENENAAVEEVKETSEAVSSETEEVSETKENTEEVSKTEENETEEAETEETETVEKDEDYEAAVGSDEEETIDDEDDEEDEGDEAAEVMQLLQEQLNHIFEKRRTKMMSRKERQKAYRTKNVVRNSKTEALTEKQVLKKEINELVASTGTIPKKILYGHIDGITSAGEGKAIVRMVTARVEGTTGQVEIRIPAKELFVTDDWEEQYEGPNGDINMLAELEGRIGSTIPFVVMYVDEAHKIAYASRLEAMAIMGQKNYINKRGETDKPRVRPGKLAEARVVGTRVDRIRVDVLGVETTLTSRDLAWEYLGALTDEFSVGEKFFVKIQEVETFKHKSLDGKRSYTLVKIKASKKEAEEDPRDKWFDSFNIGDIVEAVVKTEPGDSNRIFVSLKGKMTAQCFIPLAGIPVYGQKCIVKITDKREKEKHIYGAILKLL